MRTLLLLAVLFVGCAPYQPTHIRRKANLPNDATDFLSRGGVDGDWYSWEWNGRKYLSYYPGESMHPTCVVELPK